ncbi:unnamed protein product, partial [Ectocarpus sp. 12 AP-2014]
DGRVDARDLWLLRRIPGVCKIRDLDGRGGAGGGESFGGFSCLNRSPCISDRASRIGLRVCAMSSCSGPGLEESLQKERRGARSREETAVIFGSLFPRF